MASGVDTKLVGQVGENLVSAILGMRGYYASPYAGNVPGFDITAVHSETLISFPIQVKTSTTGSLVHSTIDKWCEHELLDGNYQRLGVLNKLKHPEMIWIMVRLGVNGISDARFFICFEQDIQKRIVNRYLSFMKLHSFRRPHGGNSRQAVLDIIDLVDFENNWELLNKKIKS